MYSTLGTDPNPTSKELKFNIQFWTLYFVYEWLSNAAIDDEYYRYFVNATVVVMLTAIASLFTVHLLIKRYYLQDRKKLFWLYFVLGLLLVVLVRRAFNYYYTYPLYFPEGQLTQPYLFVPKMVIEAANTYLIVGLYAMFYFVKAWYEQQRISHTLHQEKIRAELDLLKAQVQPHFIFNSLNNIYSLSLKKDPKTPELIYRLSSFLDYNLYDSSANHTSVSKEVDFLKNYMELQKLRFGDRIDVSLNAYSPLDGYQISPLLLLPLVENCFKHGMAEGAQKSWIRIDFSAKEDCLTVKIENSLPSLDSPPAGLKTNHHSGIGLENVTRKLKILYPGRHELTCRREKDSYLVILKLKTSYDEVHLPGN